LRRQIPITVNPSTLLSPSEAQTISEYIPNRCMCVPKVLDQLLLIFIQDFGDLEWNGQWLPVTEEINGSEAFSGGIIILNTYGLGSADGRLESLTKILCHEYGHHWTLSYAYDRVEDPLSLRFMLPWYNCRNASLRDIHYRIPCNDIDEWLHCDKEIIAEDFKNNFTPYKEERHHKMRNIEGIGLPPPAVIDYISRLHHLVL